MEKTGRIIGIDLAKRSYVAKLIDLETDKERSWQGTTDQRGLKALLGKLRPTDQIGIECCALAMKLARIIVRSVGAEVLLLNAGQLRIIYQSIKKTDLVDAEKIARLLLRFPAEELPVVRPPSPAEEYQRALVSELRFKRRLRNSLINRLHSLFVREAIVTMTLKDLHDEKNREVSLQVLSGYTLIEAQRLSREIGVFETAIADINASIHQEQTGNEQANLLLSIPGVGPVTTMTFMAYVGDGSRFANGRQVSNYAGMTPRVDSSGETTKLGGISKRGCSAIRAVVVQAAWAAVLMKGSNPLKEKFQELAARRGKGRAIVAIARRILELMWVVSVRKERYRSTTPEAWRMKLHRLRMIKVIKAESVA